MRTAAELAAVDALVLPGGESTTMSRLLQVFDLEMPLRERLAGGMPTLSTCAGLILLSSEVLDGRPDQIAFGILDVRVRRNGYGRQVESFEADVAVEPLGRGSISRGLHPRPAHRARRSRGRCYRQFWRQRRSRSSRGRTSVCASTPR